MKARKTGGGADMVRRREREPARVENEICVKGLKKATSDHPHKRTIYELDTPSGDGATLRLNPTKFNPALGYANNSRTCSDIQ